MATRRFPIIEIIDCIRQLIYVPGQPQWQALATANPDWQLSARRVYSLNTFRRDPDSLGLIRDGEGNLTPVPYAEQPFVPDPAETGNMLIRPILFDNASEVAVQATVAPCPLTAVFAEFAYSDKTLLDIKSNIGIMAADVILMVLHQDNAQSRLLRYYNWLDHALRFNTASALAAEANPLIIGYGSVDKQSQAKLYLLVSQLRRSGPREVKAVPALASIDRQASLKIRIEVAMSYVSGLPL